MNKMIHFDLRLGQKHKIQRAKAHRKLETNGKVMEMEFMI